MKANIQYSGDTSKITPPPKPRFEKKALTIEEQITLLESRGLVFTNKKTAKEHLERNSYYRLSGYMIPFYNRETETFITGTEFKTISELYYFDGDLKLLLMEALELIEVDFKTKLINELSVKYGSHRFTNKSLFLTEASYKNSKETIEKGVEKSKDSIFLKHYYNTYGEPKLPPSWMVFQILPFGDTTSIYQALNIPNKKLIANKYKLRFKQLESWLGCMYYLRNLCAHSDRVRNRRMTKKVNIKGGEDYFGTDIDFLFSYLVVICYLLRIISPECSRFSKIEKFIDTHTSVNRSKMGFPDNWKDIIKEKKLIVKDKLDTNI